MVEINAGHHPEADNRAMAWAELMVPAYLSAFDKGGLDAVTSLHQNSQQTLDNIKWPEAQQLDQRAFNIVMAELNGTSQNV